MTLTLVLIVLAVLLAGAVTGLLVWLVTVRPGSLDAQTMSEPTRSATHVPLPQQVSTSAVDGLRFDVTMRGYSMRQVDDTLDRLRDEIAGRDAQIVRLRSELDAVRAAAGESLELGRGQAVRAGDDAGLFTPGGGVRSFQAGHDGSRPTARPADTTADSTGDAAHDAPYDTY